MALIESRQKTWFSRRSWPRHLLHLAWGAVIGVQLINLLDHITFLPPVTFVEPSALTFSESKVRPIFDPSTELAEHAAVTPRSPRTWFKVFLGILVRSARADGIP